MIKKIIGGIMFFGVFAAMAVGMFIACGWKDATIIIGVATGLAIIVIVGAHLLGFLD